MGRRKFQLLSTPTKILIKISIAFLQGICVLFIGLLIGFQFYNMSVTNPILNRLSGVLDQATYQQIASQYGFNDPLLIKFGRYFIDFFSGNWGESYIVMPGEPVTEVLKKIVPRTVETMLLPIIIGLIGIKLGRIWVKKRNKIQGYVIRIFTVIGLAMPIFFIATGLQYTFGVTIPNITHGLLDIPVVFYADITLPPPPFITGLPFFDSIISGNWLYAGSIIEHGILPTIALSFVILTLFTKQTQTNIDHNSKDTSSVSNSFTAGKMFGVLFAFILIIEMTFSRTGFGYYFLMSIRSGDPFLINGSIFTMIIFFSFIIFFSNIIPVVYKFYRRKKREYISSKSMFILNNDFLNSIDVKHFRRKITEKFEYYQIKDEDSPAIFEPKIKVEKNSRIKSKIELKNYVIAKLKKNPFRTVGLGLILSLFLFLVIISVFPQLLTPYSLDQIVPPYFGGTPFAPPSPDHPLGTTKYGYDILARVIYGTRDALVFGIGVTIIGLVGGSIFGFLAGKFHRYIYNGIIGPMIVFFIIPAIGLFIVAIPLFRFDYSILGIGIGVLLILIFTQIIANAIRRERNYLYIAKTIIKYIPLEMAFAILLYQYFGFIGFMDQTTAQLGITSNYGMYSFSAVEAMFWPGFFIFLIMLSLILLHEGLKAPTAPRDVINKPLITLETTNNL